MFYTHSRFFYNTDAENAGGAEYAATKAREDARAKFYEQETPKVEEPKQAEQSDDFVEQAIQVSTALKVGGKAKEVKQEEPKAIETAKAGISDDDFIAELKRRTGKDDVTDLITPKVDEKELKAKKKSAALAYGLDKGLIKADELEDYIKANSNPHQTVYEQQLEDARLEADFDEETFRAEYEEEFGLNADKDSAKYKRGQKRLDALADNIIKSTYSNVVSIEDKYSSFETEQESVKKEEAEILAKAVPYKEMITTIANELKSFDLPIGESENVLNVDASEAIESYIEHYLDSATVKSEIKRGATKEQITQSIKNAIIIENLPNILQDAENKAVIRYRMGLKGVAPPARVAAGLEAVDDIEAKRQKHYGS